jgi:hypothetical protein
LLYAGFGYYLFQNNHKNTCLQSVAKARATRLAQTLPATSLALLMSPPPFEPAALHGVGWWGDVLLNSNAKGWIGLWGRRGQLLKM